MVLQILTSSRPVLVLEETPVIMTGVEVEERGLTETLYVDLTYRVSRSISDNIDNRH